jgi:hypothetical protein
MHDLSRNRSVGSIFKLLSEPAPKLDKDQSRSGNTNSFGSATLRLFPPLISAKKSSSRLDFLLSLFAEHYSLQMKIPIVPNFCHLTLLESCFIKLKIFLDGFELVEILDSHSLLNIFQS